MYSRCTLVVLLFALVLGLPLLVDAQRIVVPSYIYPGTDWSSINAAGNSKVSITIINPFNGPGTSIDPAYVSQAQSTKNTGIKVYGYVHSTYGAEPLQKVQGDIDRYYQWYGVEGIFIDEAATDCGFLSYYQTLYNYVKARGGSVIINPGTQTNECYMSATDIVVNFENSYAMYKAYNAPAWLTKYPPSRFWHIVHTCLSVTEMQTAVQLAVQRNSGNLFVTDRLMPNPFSKLPSYWTSHVSAVSGAVASVSVSSINYVIGKTIVGGDMSTSTATSPEDCHSKCLSLSGCVAWAFDLCGGTVATCWLKSSIGTPTERACRASYALAGTPALASIGAAAFKAQINFEAPGSVTPSGWYADKGAQFGFRDNGLTYGWNAFNGNTRERNAANSPSKLYDTLAHMQLGGTNFKWEILLSPSFYDVKLVNGDPSYTDCHAISIEGQWALGGCSTLQKRWLEYRGTIQVNDGRMTLTNTPNAGSNNKLCFIEISLSTGAVLSSTVIVSGPTPAKRQETSASDSSEEQQSTTAEQRFIAAVAGLMREPVSRFAVLKVSGDASTGQTIDYLIKDPQDNTSMSSSELATRILMMPEQVWGTVGIDAKRSFVVSEAGPVPESYSKKTNILLIVVCVIGGVLVALVVAIAIGAFFIRRRLLEVKRLARETSSSNMCMPPPSSNNDLSSTPTASSGSIALEAYPAASPPATPPTDRPYTRVSEHSGDTPTSSPVPSRRNQTAE